MSKAVSNIVSRRNLLAGLGVAGVAAAAVAAPSLSLNLAQKRKMASWWDKSGGPLHSAAVDQWRTKIGTQFELVGNQARLKLVKVEELNSKGRRPSSVGRERAFVAVFEANAAVPAGDRTYKLGHQLHGTFDVFMSAANAAGGKVRLEAVFN